METMTSITRFTRGFVPFLGLFLGALVMAVSANAVPKKGDVDGDQDVDIDDVRLIFSSRGETATGVDDPRDLDGDGIITVGDGRSAVLLCTHPQCAPSVPDLTPPQISIDSHDDGSSIVTPRVTVSGLVSDDVALEGVRVNGISASVSGDSYTVTIPLASGENIITAMAEDASGNTASASVTLYVTLIGDVIDTIKTLPRDATVEQLSGQLEGILYAISMLPRKDIGILREATSLLRVQPNIVAALRAHFESLERTQYGQRRLALGVVGELQRPDALDFFHDVVSRPLPDVMPVAEGMTARDREEMIQMKAVHGVGFIRNDDGSLNADATKQLLLVMLGHESEAVRVTAIDTYMWNHGDSANAADVLYQAIPADYHKYVTRPRFHAGANRLAFEKKLEAWQKQWGQ